MQINYVTQQLIVLIRYIKRFLFMYTINLYSTNLAYKHHNPIFFVTFFFRI